MPSSTHPQAQFVPIPPNFDLDALVEGASNFDYVTRLSTKKLKEHSIQSFESLVLAVVIQSGKPLVIEDWGSSLPPSLFSLEWLQENMGTKPESVRDIPNEINIPMTMGHYLRSMAQLTKQFTPSNYRDPKRQRLYLKDIDTPEAWAEHLKGIIPESVYYLNECIESRTGGDGAIREPNEYGQMRYGNGVAPAGDLMSSLPPEMRALNMMCYIGHEGTYTPAHREMCASLGHNIMVEVSEDGKGEKAGSSIWFMTETKEREVVSEYFLSMLGHDIEVEKHFAQVNAWKKAPFNVWVVEQKVGDLILIPPLAPHQVWNRGTRTMKAAWNRTTVDTLELALHEALPRGVMVCRDEQYKNKAIVYYTLVKYFGLLQRDTIEPKMWKYGRIKQLLEDFKRLFALYTEILVSEMFSPKLPAEGNVEFLKFDSNVTCSYCRCNIFNRFLTCKSCILYSPDGEENAYDICMDCYAMGRSCACISNLNWVEQWEWQGLLDNYEKWRAVVVDFEGHFDHMRSPRPIDIERKRYGKKPVAEVCQEQLKLRPWKDITQPDVREPSLGMSDIEPEVDDDGRPKRKKDKKFTKAGKGRLGPIKDKTHPCHVCCHHDWNWKLAFCTTCHLAYCYGVLWRAFDLMPQTVMEDKDWQCPKCLLICSCGKCRKSSTQTPYAPKGTLLGHDTRKVADYRSVESLVDFSKTNLSWLRGENDKNPHESSRMKKLKEKAEAEKARVETVDERYFNAVEQAVFADGEGGEQRGYKQDALQDEDQDVDQDIDPLLRGPVDPSISNTRSNDIYKSPYDTMDSATHEDGQALFNGLGEDQSLGWMDDHYDLDQFDNFNQQSANYPSRLLAPTAPMLIPEQSYPDPSHIGQNRMMGIGYYQQGNGIDRILYDAPNENGSEDSSQQMLTPSRNPNFALSDLFHPLLQPEGTKKRKRIGVDGDNDEEDEFFTSKKQREIAQSKRRKHDFADDDEVTYKAKPPARPPRRSVGKAKSYMDLGEDAVPIEDDEGPSVVSFYLKRKPETPDDLTLAAQAMRCLNKSPPKRNQEKKRKSQRGSLLSQNKALGSAPNTIKTPRKSAWLTRKEAKESDNEFPSELPRRERQHRSSFPTNEQPSAASPSIEVASEPEDNANGGASLEVETIGTIGKPVETELVSGIDQENAETGVTWRVSEADSSVQIAEPQTPSVHKLEKVEKLTPKPRGRPRKVPPPSVELRSPSPIEDGLSAPPEKLLSLKEKLALKGKSFKIVSRNPRGQVGATSMNTITPSVSKPILESPSPASPARWDDNTTKPTTEIAPAPPSVERTNGKSNSVTSAPTLAQPIKKGPTVVRLISPSSNEESQSDASDPTSDDESDSSIPAIRVSPKASPQASRGRHAYRGRIAMTARRGRGRGRGRGRPSLNQV